MSLTELKVSRTAIDKLIPYANNARTHSKDQIAKIASSIKEFGFNDPIAIDKDGGIIAGHGRLEAAKLLGISEVPTIQLGHLSREQQKAYIIAHNRIATDAGWDSALLELDLLELQNAGFSLELTGFDEKEIETLLNPEKLLVGDGDEDNVPGVPINPVSVLGDVWLLGQHRLMCGDSTNPEHVDKLFAGNTANLMVTDPPYGVNYDPSWRDRADLGVGERSRGKVENDNICDWTDAYSLFAGSVCYVWHAGLYSGEVATHLSNCGFELKSQIIWVKQHFALSRGDYHWQHEPCWYAVKKGTKHAWNGARDQATTWQISNNNSFGNSEPEKTWGHGTQKPVECMARPLLNNSKPGDFVYDPFGGAGTTLIAATKHDRKCLMMEISPTYIDVIIKRWEDFTKLKAILESTDQTFDEVAQHDKRDNSTGA